MKLNKLVLHKAVFYVALSVLLVVYLTPVIWMVSTSFKPESEVFTKLFSVVPSRPCFENYTDAFRERPFFRYLWNSVVVATATTAISVFFSALAGYGFAKYNFRGRHLCFLFVLSTMMIPLEVTMVPLFLLVRALGWVNSYAGLIIPMSITAFGIFLMRQFISTIPNEYIEAARVDGCSEWWIFLRIILPMSKPALTCLAIFSFTGSWNNFLWPLIVVSEDVMRTIPLGLALFENQFVSNYAQIMAVATMGSIPTLVVFFVLQKQFIEGMALSGLKG